MLGLTVKTIKLKKFQTSFSFVYTEKRRDNITIPKQATYFKTSNLAENFMPWDKVFQTSNYLLFMHIIIFRSFFQIFRHAFRNTRFSFSAFTYSQFKLFCPNQHKHFNLRTTVCRTTSKLVQQAIYQPEIFSACVHITLSPFSNLFIYFQQRERNT